ncbi:MAG: hypothetical protein HWN68_18770 [Desulfobacterales bacterium]|nr:hypothetical protein [Desulfobacterales bacterium]
MSLVESTDWYTFKCRMPKAVLDVLEAELERIKLLAHINEDLPDDIQDGLALEMITANSVATPDESVV